MAQLIIPTPLRKFTNNLGKFESTGKNVKEVIEQLVTEHSGLKPHLFDNEGNIRSFVKIYVEDDDINALDREQTVVSENTVISIIPAIAGGSY
jgi:sulfur-carrier protein